MSTASGPIGGPNSIAGFRRGVGRQSTPAIVGELMQRAERAADLNGFIAVSRRSLQDRYQVSDGLSLEGRPLSGVPFVVKDNIHVAGLPNTAATPALADFKPQNDAPAVGRLVAAGAVPFGKANMHELALGPTSISSAYGAVRHPVDRARFGGGSSGGTAVLVAAGVAPVGLGTDTGGSVRIPAALTGICGLRPTPGRYPGGGLTPLSWTRDTIGPMATTMADIATVDHILAASVSSPSGLAPESITLGLPTSHFVDDLEDGVGRLWRKALEKLEAAGFRLVPIVIPDIIARSQETGWPFVAYEAQRALQAYLGATVGIDLAQAAAVIATDDVRAVVMDSFLPDSKDAVSHGEYGAALQSRAQMQATYRGLFAAGINGVVFPTTPAVAGPISSNESAVVRRQRYIRNTDPGSVAGLPGLTIPMGCDEQGMPAGLALDCAAGHDEEAISIALTIEAVLSASA